MSIWLFEGEMLTGPIHQNGTSIAFSIILVKIAYANVLKEQ